MSTNKQVTPEAPAAAAAVGTVDVAAMQTEMDRLRRENEILRRGQAGPAAELSAVRGPVRRFKVSLPDAAIRANRYVVSPRLGCHPSIAELPAQTFCALDLFLNEAERDPSKIAEAAWKRFSAQGANVNESGFDGVIRTRQIDPIRDRKQFEIMPDAGPHVPYLTIRAASKSEAFELFAKFNGILHTTRTPVVEELPAEELGVSA